jgi:hypothetical protein
VSRRRRERWDDIDYLRAFDYEVDELGRRRLVAEGMENTFNVSWSAAEKQLSVTATEHHEDDLRAFCTDYRKFISNDEPVFLPRIYNILERKLTSDHLRTKLRLSREAWRRTQEGAGLSVTVDDRRTTPEHVMDVFINGRVFHMDTAKRQEFQRLWPNPVTRFQMNNLVVEACRQLFFVQSIVRVALREGLLT